MLSKKYFLEQSIQKKIFYFEKGSTACANRLSVVKFFSKVNEFIFEYFDPINIFFDNENK